MFPTWQSEEIRDHLVQQDWTNVEIPGKRRQHRKNVHWNAKAQTPQAIATQSAWRYDCHDGFRVTINENWTRPSLPIVFTSAPGPRRKWHDKVEDELPRKPDRSKKDAVKAKEVPNVEAPRAHSRSPQAREEEADKSDKPRESDMPVDEPSPKQVADGDQVSRREPTSWTDVIRAKWKEVDQ